MKLTKHEHAYLALEEQGSKLIIDPGKFSNDLGDITNVVAVVITHSHFDHLNADNIVAIMAASPGAQILSTQTVAGKLQGRPVTVVSPGQTITVGPFKLEFFGGKHAYIHDTTPDEQNVGVLVNDNLYYPGDSLAQPGVPVKTLAVPVSGPWLKIGEAVDFMVAVKPALSVPAHDGLLTPVGETITEDWLTQYSSTFGGVYRHLAVGDAIEI
ncbi:MAG: MBL fold metallo-hydrolase [Candidatus Saccharibacteria bacterium]